MPRILSKKFKVLNRLQVKFLEYFVKHPLAKNFYWTGGTALAECYLEHRISEDIDLFTRENFIHEEAIKLMEGFIESYKDIKDYSTARIYDRREFILEPKKGKKIKIEFVKYDFPSIKNRKKWNKIPIFIDTLRDIAANKSMSIFDRNEPKDLIDFYYILKYKNYQLDHLLRWLKEKFGPTFDKNSFVAEMMNTLEDIDKLAPTLLIPKSKQKQEIKKIKKFFIEMSNEYLKSVFI
jgi:predicted nucleotidyltransferase component of viral defense system